MRVGLIGLPRSGKTSVFNALTRSEAPTHAYEVHEDRTFTAVVPVPDRRFEVAVRICQPKKRVPATIEVVDGAARVEVHDRGQKFGTDFFSGVRTMDALVLVLRGFPLVEGEHIAPSQPARDADAVDQELMLADLAVLEGRLERLAKAKAGRKASGGGAVEEDVIRRMLKRLEAMEPLRSGTLDDDELRLARAFGLVSAKPLILLLNIAEADLQSDSDIRRFTAAYAQDRSLPLIVMCAKVEADIARMSPEEEREFDSAMGIAEPARDTLVRVAYQHMQLISFLTVGSDEVRAWTIKRGTTALGAAEKVHTDLARNFIRAEVMAFEDFEAAGGWDAARSAGKMRLEGKDYVVRDGEIVHIRASRG